MKEKRRHIRTRVTLKTKITHPTSGSITLITRDISDNGMFLLVDSSPLLPVGEVVDVQIVGIVDHPPVCRMKVVRLENDGIGLMLCNDE